MEMSQKKRNEKNGNDRIRHSAMILCKAGQKKL